MRRRLTLVRQRAKEEDGEEWEEWSWLQEDSSSSELWFTSDVRRQACQDQRHSAQEEAQAYDCHPPAAGGSSCGSQQSIGKQQIRRRNEADTDPLQTQPDFDLTIQESRACEDITEVGHRDSRQQQRKRPGNAIPQIERQGIEQQGKRSDRVADTQDLIEEQQRI